jgi:hypothetical protein
MLLCFQNDFPCVPLYLCGSFIIMHIFSVIFFQWHIDENMLVCPSLFTLQQFWMCFHYTAFSDEKLLSVHCMWNRTWILSALLYKYAYIT